MIALSITIVTFTIFQSFTCIIDFTLKMATGHCQPKYQFEINKNILDLAFIIFILNRNEQLLVIVSFCC